MLMYRSFRYLRFIVFILQLTHSKYYCFVIIKDKFVLDFHYAITPYNFSDYLYINEKLFVFITVMIVRSERGNS